MWRLSHSISAITTKTTSSALEGRKVKITSVCMVKQTETETEFHLNSNENENENEKDNCLQNEMDNDNLNITLHTLVDDIESNCNKLYM